MNRLLGLRPEDLLLAINRISDAFVSTLEKKKEILSDERVGRALVIGLLFVLVLLLSGWSYVLVYKPRLIYGASTNIGSTFISPEQLGEGPIEALIVGLLYAMGFAGLYWSYSIYSRRRGSSPEIIIALVLILISVISLYWIGSSKAY